MHKTDKCKHIDRRTDTDVERDRLTQQRESRRALERASERECVCERERGREETCRVDEMRSMAFCRCSESEVSASSNAQCAYKQCADAATQAASCTAQQQLMSAVMLCAANNFLSAARVLPLWVSSVNEKSLIHIFYVCKYIE